MRPVFISNSADQTRPPRLTTAVSIRPDDSAISESQRDLDEGVNSAGWSTEAVSDDRFRELIDRGASNESRAEVARFS